MVVVKAAVVVAVVVATAVVVVVVATVAVAVVGTGASRLVFAHDSAVIAVYGAASRPMASALLGVPWRSVLSRPAVVAAVVVGLLLVVWRPQGT